MPKKQQAGIIIIVGPTASGKSDLAIKIARKLKGEIISADSRQVYRGMDIGTGKVSRKEQKIIRHHLIDIASPKKVFTADNFKKYGQIAIDEIIGKDKQPIIVGGTGFYIDTLLGKITTPLVPPNPKLRKELEKKSLESLLRTLEKLDPQRFNNIDRKNKRRIIRAIEIIKTTGKPVPKLEPKESEHNIIWLGIKIDKLKLEKNIEARLKKRFKMGMINEVRKLIASGVSHKRLEDLGLEYRYISRFLKGQINKKELSEQLFLEIKRYSKRQATWFKKNKEINWISNYSEALAILKNRL